MHILFTSSLVVLYSCGALAADFPARVFASASVISANPSWAGAYFGVVGTTGMLTVTADDQRCWVQCTSATTSGFGGGLGFTIGFNAQRRGLVYGVEADWSGMFFNANDAWFDSVTILGVQRDYKVDWYGTLRGRIGVSFGDSLVYTTAGVTLMGGRYSLYFDLNSDSAAHLAGDGFFKSATPLGITLGAGVEHKIDKNWSLKAEYIYLGFGHTKPVVYADLAQPVSLMITMKDNARFTPSVQSVRIGMNYQLRGSSTPVIARD